MSNPRTNWAAACIVVLAFFSAPQSHAVQPDEILADPKLESRARALSQGLRCMVCQNQSIDDSDAPLARDLRILVRDRLKAGDSDERVLDYVTSRYGAFVLLKPRFGWSTVVLWFAPLAAVLAGIAAVVMASRRRRQVPSAVNPLSADEQRRLEELTGR